MVKSIYFGNCLTVGELIERLKEFPQDLPVCTDGYVGIEIVEKRTYEDFINNRPEEDFIYIG